MITIAVCDQGSIVLVQDKDVIWLETAYVGHRVVLPLVQDKAQELIDALQFELDRDMSETGV